MSESAGYTVICSNVHHKRASVGGEDVEFSPDPESLTARAEVSEDLARAFAQMDGYEVPGLTAESDLDDLKGVGKARSAELAKAGVTTQAELAGADVESLAEATGIDQDKLEAYAEEAAKNVAAAAEKATASGEGSEESGASAEDEEQSAAEAEEEEQ